MIYLLHACFSVLKTVIPYVNILCIFRFLLQFRFKKVTDAHLSSNNDSDNAYLSSNYEGFSLY